MVKLNICIYMYSLFFFYLLLFYYWWYSRPSKTKDWDYDFFVDFDAVDNKQVENVVEQLRKHTKDVCIIGSENTGGMYILNLIIIIMKKKKTKQLDRCIF